MSGKPFESVVCYELDFSLGTHFAVLPFALFELFVSSLELRIRGIESLPLFSAAGLFFGFADAYEESEFVSSSLLAVYCTFLIANAIASFMQDSKPPIKQTADIEKEEAWFDKKCAGLATEFSLSPREREIIAFLGRGHTSAFIAKSLIISESTVYTHTRNIYRKLGIGSKEELIQIFTAPHSDLSEHSNS